MILRIGMACAICMSVAQASKAMTLEEAISQNISVKKPIQPKRVDDKKQPPKKKVREDMYENRGHKGFNVGWGLGYGFDFHTSKLAHDTKVTSGLNHKFSVLIATQYVMENGVLFEIPFTLSYIMPDERYFAAFHNNNGFGAQMDIGFLSGYYLYNRDEFKLAFKGGLGYTFANMRQTSYRMSPTDTITDTSSVTNNMVDMRLGAEIGSFKHHLGVLARYYLWNHESSRLHARGANSAVPIVSEASKTFFDSLGMNVYYMYRF